MKAEEALVEQLLNDIANVLRRRLRRYGHLPLVVRYEAAKAALAVVRAYLNEQHAA